MRIKLTGSPWFSPNAVLRKLKIRPALFLAFGLFMMPAVAHADCVTEIAKAYSDAKGLNQLAGVNP
jgi:hypothetical protein